MSNKHFASLVARSNPTGEVIAVDRFLIRVNGLNPVSRHALVMFEDSSKGIVWEVTPDYVVVLHLGSTALTIGCGVVLQHTELVTKVGTDYLGRVISVTGEPLDGKGPIAPQTTWPVFNQAPPLIDRRELDTQITTGVTVVDTLFPLVRGQRMAILGESKSGKSAFLTQIAMSQKNTDQIMVFGLVGKRRTDIDDLLRRLTDSGVMEQCVVIVSTIFDSLATSYLVPYVSAAMAEYFWLHAKRDTVVAYDDLTSHAMAHREISLLAGLSPGRDSYPGDMFYAHSSLLERAGRLKSTGKCLTSLPTVLVGNGDITAYLPTNIMSITDGQYIFDLDIFRSGVRPAINTGLSVSRVGARGHNKRQKEIGGKITKKLAAYREADEFSHFGSELALEARADLELGKLIIEVMKQGPLDRYTLQAQQLMLDIVLNLTPGSIIDTDKLKQLANEYGEKVTSEDEFPAVRDQLLDACAIELKGAENTEESLPDAPVQTATSDSSTAKKIEVK